MEHNGEHSAIDSPSESIPQSKWKGSKRNVKLNIYHTLSKLYGSSGSRIFKVPGSEPQVRVGPVIGKVTATTARILVEVDRSGILAIEVREKPQALEKQPSFLQKQLTLGRRGSTKINRATGPLSDTEFVVQKGVKANRPVAFEFRDLTPETAYIVEVKGCAKDVTASSFRTFSATSTDVLTFGVISCNKIFITDIMIPPALDLWSHLSKLIEAGKVDYLLHLGDQIYGDGDKRQDAEAGADKDAWSDRFRKSMELLKGVPAERWIEHQEVVCEFYREVYRDTWRHPPTAKCLANCPSLMIYDDHEVRDNWGDVKEDWNKSSVDFFVARCAWIVSMEYQRQLYEDVDFNKVDNVHQDYHFHLIGGVGLMFLDIRGSRTFHRVDGDEKIYLGDGQWSAIQNVLSTEGLFAEARALLVCTPAPLVFLEPRITQSAAAAFHRLEDFKGHWSFGEHIKEQILMIDSLREWKSARNREVLILGGDVHCGGHSDIIRDHEVVFRQLTTSAIANVPLPKSAYYFMRAAGRLGGLTEEYKFRHYKWTRSRNYGLVQVKYHGPPDETREVEPRVVEVTAQLVKGRLLGPPIHAEKVSNLSKRTMSCVCTS